ncbi:hypothetical protein MIR68_003179 [Amoeboaphelidium protococcarum]|nr:hypothetical protein MIR68_003179 [Amoeboaphelidium protococcarum]
MAWAPSKLAKKTRCVNLHALRWYISDFFAVPVSWHDFGPLIPLEGNQNGLSYINTIDSAVIPYIKKLRKDHGVRPVFSKIMHPATSLRSCWIISKTLLLQLDWIITDMKERQVPLLLFCQISVVYMVFGNYKKDMQTRQEFELQY